jgi:hypothetical protein
VPGVRWVGARDLASLLTAHARAGEGTTWPWRGAPPCARVLTRRGLVSLSGRASPPG